MVVLLSALHLDARGKCWKSHKKGTSKKPYPKHYTSLNWISLNGVTIFLWPKHVPVKSGTQKTSSGGGSFWQFFGLLAILRWQRIQPAKKFSHWLNKSCSYLKKVSTPIWLKQRVTQWYDSPYIQVVLVPPIFEWFLESKHVYDIIQAFI